MTSTYKQGTLAYLDTLSCGMVPVKVTEVLRPGHGRMSDGSRILYTVTATRGAYPKGYKSESTSTGIVPRSHVRLPTAGSGQARPYNLIINTDYEWV